MRIFDYLEGPGWLENRRCSTCKETAIAQGKQELIKQAFADWIWKDRSAGRALCKLYNEEIQLKPCPEYDGAS